MKNHIKQKLKMIWRILRDKQVIVITESYGRMYYDWDTRSLEDVCQMCHQVHDIAYRMDNWRINNDQKRSKATTTYNTGIC